jgi:tetratricopeptide (TPR) repeat protein
MRVADLSNGVVLGERFRLVRLLGRGSFGDVWLADNLSYAGLPAKVALKVYLQKHQNRALKVLLEEAEVAARFEHDRLVRVYGAERIDGLVLMWMEYVEGPTLLHQLGPEDAPKPVSLDNTLAWLRDIADGLAYLHAQDPPLIHGDLKLDNVMLSAGGARLLDFGQSRVVEERFVTTGGTGCLPYMAPETLGHGTQGEGRRYVSSDIYACGVIAYRFLTGRFPRRTVAEVMNLVPFPRPLELNSSVPKGLDLLVMRCLEKRPDRRYRTGSELLAAVEALQRELAGATLQLVSTPRTPASVLSMADELERLAQELVATGRAEEAVDQIEQVLQRLSTSPGLLLVYAEAARAANRLEVAHLVYRRLLRWLDSHGASAEERRDALEGRAELDVRLKHYDDAAEAFGWLVEHWPTRRWYRFRFGVTLGLAGRYSQALEQLSALHAVGSPSGVVCAKLGLVHRQIGDVNTAIQYFNEALMMDAHEPVALAQLAEIRAIQGHNDKALIYLERLEQVEGAEADARRLRRMLAPH